MPTILSLIQQDKQSSVILVLFFSNLTANYFSLLVLFLCLKLKTGASFCYEKSVGALFEAQEVRAFGLFLNDLVQRIVYLTPTDEKNVGNPLQNLVDSCINLPAKNRLSFADVVRVLPSISN